MAQPMKPLRTLAFPCALVLTACATINSVGPNTFVAESNASESLGIREANEFCSQRRLAALITTIIPSTERAYSKVYFKCLDPNSDEYRRSNRGPSYQPTPNVIIQDNRSRP